MESANLHQHHQDHHLQLAGSSSSSSLGNSTDPFCYGASTTAHQWSPAAGVSLNSMSLSQNYSNEMIHTRDHNNVGECLDLSHMHNHSMTQQDLAIQWHHHQSSYDNDHHHHDHHHNHHHHQDHQSLLKIKEELSSSNQIQADNIPKFTDMLNNPLATTDYLKMKEHDKDFNDMTEKLLLKTISSLDGEYCNYPPSSSPSPSSSSSSHRGKSFSQIHPSLNISSLSHSPTMSMSMSMSMNMNMNMPRPFDMNMHVLDGRSLVSGSGLVNNANPPEINLGMMSRGSLPFGLGDQNFQQTITPIDQMTHFSNDPQASEGKRNNLLMAAKGGENIHKKPRVESRSSCPPLKVRKEKLGERIAALQQLVSPFGKTDTASVLMEAIGYIKFLQNQIETLSVPYMRASRNRTVKSSQRGCAFNDGMKNRNRI
ncbi:PREDICTED: transcription factor bHLH110 [Tarenaya hassleriana]|uniref:transcription factor bHLH110 n=1 Tax=Tarenaya hassleriana TaxID=28532 RepID=UPI00053C1BAB|nr:PREDICTED: transcription factor bHLH110 [Tarenaya hassleriana]